MRKLGIEPDGGIEITSQQLYDSIKGQKKVMKSTTGDMTTQEYSIVKAVLMGDADVWGEKIINRLSVLDRVLTDVIEMDEIEKAIREATE